MQNSPVDGTGRCGGVGGGCRNPSKLNDLGTNGVMPTRTVMPINISAANEYISHTDNQEYK